MVTIYGLKNCDSCRKVLKAFPGATLVDIRAEGLPDGLLERAFTEFGSTVLNTRSTTWRGLSDEEKSQDPLALIKLHPTLMKRPLMAVDDRLFIGFNSRIEGEVKALL